ncbi:MAG: hypothetical protein EBX50_06250 [Chitinophagia bacterium]|nr:hypothetical protein [Chitinophagia bacterium]
MEVHPPHHPTHKKNWKEYLLEFLMLFFAVTLGFFAENIREKMSEKQKAKELIETVAKDLKIDLEQLKTLKNFQSEKVKLCDSFRTLITSNPASIDQRDFYRVVANFTVFFTFPSNDKSRLEAESKGYLSDPENSLLADYLHKYSFWLNDYRDLDKIYLNHAQKYMYEILPIITDPDIFDIQWRFPFPTLKSKIGITPLSPAAIRQTKYTISNTKALMDTYKSDMDSMICYAKKSIDFIEHKYK